MGTCRLELEVDRADHPFRPGEVITGRIRVYVDAPCRCDALRVALVWETHGRGNRRAGEVSAQPLFTGEWTTTTEVYPFELTVPEWPRAYHGHLVNLDFRVRATADVPWAIDPTATADVLIVPTPAERIDVTLPTPEPSGSGGGLGCGVALLLGGGLLTAIGETEAIEPVLAFGFFGIAIGLLVVAFTLGPWLAARKLGGVSLWLERVPPGRDRDTSDDPALQCFVRVKPGAPVEQITATFVILERVERGSGSDRQVERHELYAEDYVLEPAGAPGLYGVTVPVPRAGAVPYSFRAPDNAVLWQLRARVVIASWPDWEQTLDIVATPPGIPAPATTLS